ncbi:MAG: hypothetical protein K2Y42_19840 [Hyphomicrobium sp.]|jgi:hypothetical protein|uniref:A1S_2505 family phage non-structural protein n=1 Tax=Hyphomicrobium sp. TaxID=82 RepID=UPI0025C280B1|nr:hypothetical protein [Hyphomicrobium sp.]MBX9865000.1 hypothetical protein [Hyphomicrobium sp.]
MDRKKGFALNYSEFPFIPPFAIFVFASNLAGLHVSGAARIASEHYGAIDGQATGLQGRSYAIPVKDENLKSIPLSDVKPHVDRFVGFARGNPQLRFVLIPPGLTDIAERSPRHAPLFNRAPHNVIRPKTWHAQPFIAPEIES